MKNNIQVFGKGQEHLIKVLFETCASLEANRYYFTSVQVHETIFTADPIKGYAIQWDETLQNCHMIATISLLRINRWISGIIDALKTGNYIVFCSCLRGLQEACGDSFHTLKYIPLSLAKYHKPINLAISKTSDMRTIYLSPILDIYIEHFFKARKITGPESKELRKELNGVDFETYVKVNEAKTAKEYITQLDSGELKSFYSCYVELCEITHPASGSVDMFLKQEVSGEYCLNISNDINKINSFIDKYSDILPDLLKYSVNTPLLTLKVLNEYPKFKNSYISTLNFDNVPVWSILKEMINNSEIIDK